MRACTVGQNGHNVSVTFEGLDVELVCDDFIREYSDVDTSWTHIAGPPADALVCQLGDGTHRLTVRDHSKSGSLGLDVCEGFAASGWQ